jgi:acetyl coenzyme A synthetase (ADP forming)-like protein
VSTKGDPASLDAFFRPRSIAVVGASRDPASLGGAILANLLARGFQGPLYPVNPAADHVQSVPAYASVSAVPGAVDLAVIVVPPARVLDVVDDCGAKGVRAAVVITAGFAETGEPGRALQDALVRRAERHHIRLVGPNCFGILNTDPAVRLHATFADTWPDAGDVAFSSQSGALGLVVLQHAAALGLGIHHFVSVGNKADVSGNDLLEYWEEDEGTRLILLYLENLGHPGRFMRLARRIGRRKPIVVVKSGRTEAGAVAARSHTGALAGLEAAADALFAQAGIVRTDTLEDLFDTALVLSSQPLPAGPRVAILTNAGGPAIMAADACASFGLALAAVGDGTRARLRAFLPAEAALGNPVDMIASARAYDYEQALRLLLADDGIDSVLVVYVPRVASDAPEVAEGLRRAAAGAGKPVVTCFMGLRGIAAVQPALRAARLPSFPFPEAAAKALAHAVRYGEWRRRPEEPTPSFDVDRDAARRVLGCVLEEGPGDRWLRADETAALLGAYGITCARGVVARSAEEAAAAARSVAGPVAVKLLSRTVVHKTDVGGVHLGVRGPDEARQAFLAIEAQLVAAGRRAEMDGVLVQEMVNGGVETFVGATRDPLYGPLLAFGIGGVQVEVWRDVVFRVHPLGPADARDMLEEIRGRALLDGVRGAPAADRGALVDVILRLDRLVGDHPEVAEVDLNPLLARPSGAIVLDARIHVAGAVAEKSADSRAGQAIFSAETIDSPA